MIWGPQLATGHLRFNLVLSGLFSFRLYDSGPDPVA